MPILPLSRLQGGRAEAAEAIGTFLLVACGCGAIAADLTSGGKIGAVGVALAFAFVVAALVYAFGHVSGAHLNPAVTLAFAATGHFSWRRVPTYVLAQLLGAILAGLLLWAIFGEAVAGAATTMVVAPWKGVVLETVATALLALVIVSVATDARASPGAAGLAIGLAVGVGALAIGPLTGGSMNPARTLGPALASGTYAGLWVYLVAPVVGAALGMLSYELLREVAPDLATRPNPALDEEPS